MTPRSLTGWVGGRVFFRQYQGTQAHQGTLIKLAIRAYDEPAKQCVDMWGEQIPKETAEQILQEVGYEPGATQGVENAVRPELISSPRRGEADGGAGQAEAGGDQGAAQARQPESGYNRDFLNSYTAEGLKAHQAQLDTIEKERVKVAAELAKQEKARRDHEIIKRASVGSAKTFELGQDAETNLSAE